MNIYKVTFVKNKIESCKIADTTMKESIKVQRYQDTLIHALIKAESEDDARSKADELIAGITPLR